MDYYTHIAKGYNELHSEEQNKKLTVILENLPDDFKPKADDELLDVGCGTGISTAFWNCKVTGGDPSDGMIEIARKSYPKLDFLTFKAESLPLNNNEFDIVVSLTAIQNFDDIKLGLDEIKRVGKNKFILTYLRKSPKANIIESEIKSHFKIVKRLEEEKDIIFFCK